MAVADMEVEDSAVAGIWGAGILGVEDLAVAGAAEGVVEVIPEECILEVESTSAEEWVIIGVAESVTFTAAGLVIFVVQEVSFLAMAMVWDTALEDTDWDWD